MEIADAFGSLVSGIKPETTIDIGALRLLSHDAVPEEIRLDAVEKAEAGDRITLAKAKKLIAGEVADKIAELRRDEPSGTHPGPDVRQSRDGRVLIGRQCDQRELIPLKGG